MLSTVARSAVRTLNAPAQQVATQSRKAFTLPLILSGQRFYSATASEAAEHPDPSSTATTTTTRSRASPRAVEPGNAQAKALKDSKAKDLAKAKKDQKLKKNAIVEEKKAVVKEKTAAKKAVVMEKTAAKKAADKVKAAEKAKAEKEKAEAQRATQKKKAKAEKEKAEAQRATQKEKAQKNLAKEKAKAQTLAEKAEIAAAVSNVLVLPKRPSASAWALYIQDKTSEMEPGIGAAPYTKILSKKWSNEDAAIKDAYAERAKANFDEYSAAYSEFILAHTPLEIYNHNRAVRLLKKKDVSRTTLNRGYKLPSEARLTQIVDPRFPGPAPNARLLYISEKFHTLDAASNIRRLTQATHEFTAMSENEIKTWEEKAAAQRKEVWAPAMMAAFGTTDLNTIVLENKSAPSVAA